MTTPMPSEADIDALTAQVAQSSADPFPLRHFAPLIRQINAANGWGAEFTFEPYTPVYLALIDSEIGEAWGELCALCDPGATPFLDELGDVIIRGLDLIELLRPGQAIQMDVGNIVFLTSNTPERHLLDLLAFSRDALQTYRKVAHQDAAILGIAEDLMGLCLLADAMISRYGGSGVQVVAALLKRNRLRGQRHGGRRC